MSSDKMKKVSFYVLGLALLTLALISLHLKGLFDAALLEQSKIDQQITSAVCDVFEDISTEHSAEIEVKDCANIGNGSFKLIANTEKDQFHNLIGLKLDVKDQLSFPYQISSKIPTGKNELTPSDLESEDSLQTAYVTIEVPTLRSVVLTGWGIDFFLMLIILSIMIWIYYNIISVLRDKNPYAYISEINTIQIGKYAFDVRNQALSINDMQRRITTRECQLLRYLLNRKNQIARRDEILMALWGENDYFKGRSLDVFIARLRKHLSDDETIRIETVHGVGFILMDRG